MKKDLILIGGGGHCRSCIDVIEQEGKYRVAGILDKSIPRGNKILGYPVIGNDSQLNFLFNDAKHFLVTLGQIKTSCLRDELFNKVDAAGGIFARVISPLAYVSVHSRIGVGTIIMHRAMVNAEADISDNCIINTGAIVEHDVKIGKHSHISTGSVVNGGVRIGDHTFVGSRVVIREGVKVGAHVVVASGVSVYKDIPDNTLMKG